MPLLYPTILLRRVTGITPRLLRRMGVKALILDADNTLTTHNNPVPDKDVAAWLQLMRSNNIRMIIASNNSRERIAPFARGLGLPYESRALKPLDVGLRRAARRMKVRPNQVAVVGDQIFTDILGGNLFRAKTILVEPMKPETGPLFRLKRKAEVYVLRRYRAGKGGER